MPSPEQIQAAMPAMREWVHYDLNYAIAEPLRWGDEEVVSYADCWYAGGVAQFIADQEGRRG